MPAPVRLFLSAGPQVSAEKAGSIYPSASYSDTRTVVGWTAGGGLQGLVTRNLVGQVKVDYDELSSHTFSNRYGDYKLKEHDVSISVGVITRF